MRTPSKIITALALAGLAVAGGSAFTAAGLEKGGAADADGFVGGTASQSVEGATLTNIAYEFANAGQTDIAEVTLTFSAVTAASTVDIAFLPEDASSEAYTCTAVAANGTESVCTAPTAPGEHWVGSLESTAVTVTPNTVTIGS